MLRLFRVKKNTTEHTFLRDSLSCGEGDPPFNWVDYNQPGSSAAAAATAPKTKKFGFRTASDLTELGVYHSVAIDQGAEQLFGTIPIFRYVGIQPESIGAFSPVQRNFPIWGSPLHECGFDNLFDYNAKGHVTRQYSIMGSEPPSRIKYQPFAFCAYNRATYAWNEIIYVILPDLVTWAYIDRPARSPDELPDNHCVETRTVWEKTSIGSSFVDGRHVGGVIDGYAHLAISIDNDKCYYSGEFQNGQKHGKGSELKIMSSGEARFLRGTWCQGRSHGECVVEFTSSDPRKNRIERGTYQMGKRVGIWVAQHSIGLEVWFQDDFLIAFQDDGEFLSCERCGNTASGAMQPGTFLTALLQHQCHALILKVVEKVPVPLLLDMCAASVQEGELRTPIACFANSMKPVAFPFLNYPMQIDDNKLLTIFQLALNMLDSAPDSPLYEAVKRGITLYDPRLTQKTITHDLAKLFSDVRYTEVCPKAEKKAIANYRQQVRKHYFTGILQRIDWICYFLGSTDRLEVKTIRQLFSALKDDDDLLTEQHDLETKRVEAERVEQLKVARWKGVCWKLDEEVLASMKNLRTDEKSDRTLMMDTWRRDLEALDKPALFKTPVTNTKTKSMPKQSVVHEQKAAPIVPKTTAVSIKNVPESTAVRSVAEKPSVSTAVAVQMKHRRQALKKPDPSVLTMKPVSYPSYASAVSSNRSQSITLEKAVESTTSCYCTDSQTLFPDFSPHRMGDTISAKNQEKESVNQHINNSRYDSTAFSRITKKAELDKDTQPLVSAFAVAPSDRLRVDKPSHVSGAASARAGFFSSPVPSEALTLKRPSIHDGILNIPEFVERWLPKFDRAFIHEYGLIYQGMIIKALQAQHQPVSLDEESCLFRASLVEKKHFLGVKNAFLSSSALYTSMVSFAQFHATALIYVSQGKEINLDDVRSVFEKGGIFQSFIQTMMQLPRSSASDERLFTDDAILQQMVFGLLILLCDEMGLGKLVDRQTFIGDYRVFLAVMRNAIVRAAPDNSAKKLLLACEKTATACLRRIITPPMQSEDLEPSHVHLESMYSRTYVV